MQQRLLGGVDVAGPVRNGRAQRHLKAHLSEPHCPHRRVSQQNRHSSPIGCPATTRPQLRANRPRRTGQSTNEDAPTRTSVRARRVDLSVTLKRAPVSSLTQVFSSQSPDIDATHQARLSGRGFPALRKSSPSRPPDHGRSVRPVSHPALRARLHARRCAQRCLRGRRPRARIRQYEVGVGEKADGCVEREIGRHGRHVLWIER